MSNIIWIIVIGLIAGLIARFVSPGPNGPSGFILTTVLGIVGAFVATFIGQLIGWYQLDQGAGLIGATVGAVIVLFIWNRLVVHHVIGDPGAGPQGRTFQQGGLGQAAQSWVGTGSNQKIASNDLARVLGTDTLDALSKQTGVNREDLLAGFSQHLPDLIDQLTPDGRLPTEAEASRMV